jgi:hypothetical protein
MIRNTLRAAVTLACTFLRLPGSPADANRQAYCGREGQARAARCVEVGARARGCSGVNVAADGCARAAGSVDPHLHERCELVLAVRLGAEALHHLVDRRGGRARGRCSSSSAIHLSDQAATPRPPHGPRRCVPATIGTLHSPHLQGVRVQLVVHLDGSTLVAGPVRRRGVAVDLRTQKARRILWSTTKAVCGARWRRGADAGANEVLAGCRAGQVGCRAAQAGGGSML